MQIPRLKTKYGENIGIELFIQFPDISEYEETFLSGDEALGQTTLSVISGKNFSDNDYVLIGNVGDETAELRQVSSQTDTTLVTDALDFAHPRGTRIKFIPYNQIVVSRSTDGTTYTPLSAVDIRPDATETYIQRSSDASTDYYKYRFYNATTALYSAYSDIVVGSGYADNTVFSIKDRALSQLGEKVGDVISDKFLNEALWEARRELDNDKAIGKWSFRFKRNANIGSIVPGTYQLSLPTNLRKPNTNENILSLRVGQDGEKLDYQDINRFNQNYYGIPHTTLNGVVGDTDVTIVLTDSGDFDESGSIYVAGADISGTIDTIAYTGNTESTNTLTGVTGIATGGHVTGLDVWQDQAFGLPTAYTIDGENKKIEFDVPFDDDYAGENIYMDYYTKLPDYNSDSDVLDEPECDLFVSYLKWKIKYLKSNGTLKPTEDGDYAEWLKRKDDLISKEKLGQDIYFCI
jgi:hypothetical protein